jgi:hypothetical protein
MRVISDLAPPWAIGDLVTLLDDANEEVRVLAATALLRLTGETHGSPPEKWRSAAAELATARDAWKSWWSTNRQRYPLRIEKPTLVPPATIPPPPGRTKVRRADPAVLPPTG